mgnify:CR=1 FL=1
MKLFFFLIFSLLIFKVQAYEIKVPGAAVGIKEIKAFEKELKYIKSLKNQYFKKNKILNDLALESKKLLREKKKFLRKKSNYQRNIKKFQTIKNHKIISKKPYKIRKRNKKSDLIISEYISKVRKLLSKRDIALSCQNRESRKFPFTLYRGVTSSLLTIDSKGKLLNLKFVSPEKNGLHNQNILKCLSQEITLRKFPAPPTNKPLTILQPFLFSS